MLHFFFDRTFYIHHVERFGLCKKRRKKYKCPCPKKHDKKKNKEKWKTAHISAKDKRESSAKGGCEFQPQKFYTHAHLDLIVWLAFSIWIRSLTLQHVRPEYATSSFPTLNSTKSHTRDREKGGNIMLWWGIIHIEQFERIIWGVKLFSVQKIQVI